MLPVKRSTVEATFVELDDLIPLERTAGRMLDLLDIEQLQALREEPGDGRAEPRHTATPRSGMAGGRR